MLAPAMDPAARPNVLVLYGLLQYPLRQWHSDHLYSFREYARSRCFYVNVGVRRIPHSLREVKWDAVVLHHTLTGQRMQPPILDFQLKRAGAVKGMAPLTIAMIQDECIYTDLMAGLINEFEVDHVFSLAPESEWRKIYPEVDHDAVRFHRVLAGYLDESTLGRIEGIVEDDGRAARSTSATGPGAGCSRSGATGCCAGASPRCSNRPRRRAV